MESSEIGIFRRRVNPDATMRLFCLPYAGGSSTIFYRWSEYVPPALEVCSVQLPGRDGRLNMAPYTSMQPLVQAAARALLPLLDKPYALFGHSFGALVAFELARYFHDQGMPTPLSLLVSAADAPHLGRTAERLHTLPDDKLISRLSLLQGASQEILRHSEVMQLLLPTIRADLQVFETYSYRAGPPLPCSIGAFGGIGDERVKAFRLDHWRCHTRAAFSLTLLRGDHFFIHSACRELIEGVEHRLEIALEELRPRTHCGARQRA